MGKNHNYVNVLSTAELDEINSNLLLSDGVKRDLITLHRINKNVKSLVMDSITRTRDMLSDQNIELEESDKIGHIEVNTYKGTDDVFGQLASFLGPKFNKDVYKDATITNATTIVSTIVMQNDSWVISKLAVINYVGNTSNIPHTAYINDCFIIL